MDRKKIIRLTIEISIVIILVVSFFIINEVVKDNKRCTFTFKEDSNFFAYQVDELYVDKEELVFKGWFFELESVQNVQHEVNKNNEFGILLYDLDSEKELFNDGSFRPAKGLECSVDHFKREDVNDYFKCEYDYSNSGFTARIKLNSLNIEEGKYQVVFKPERNEDEGILSSVYIDKGVLRYIDPKDYYPLDIQGTDLEKVVNGGNCLVSRPDFHICVYQYENKLFWIADENYDFEIDGSTYIQFALDTTQYDRLPSDSKEHGWSWSDISGQFEDYEVTDTMNCGRYRVCVRDIPQEYSVYHASTGHYVSEWIWNSYFRPLVLQP